MKAYLSSSSANTKKIAGEFAKKVLRLKQKRHATVLGFVGDLGAGKTTFIHGFLRALGVRKKVTSPTFVLIKRHAVKSKNFKHAYHADSYRLKSPHDFEILDFKKIVSSPDNIILMEWAEKVKRLLPKDTIWVTFRHGKDENERKINLKKKV